MGNILLALLLLQASPANTGIASGVVLAANGTPAAGVRVFALPAGDPNAVSASNASVFESLAQTDASGRYRLEVPAGRYYIAAGSVNTPTYYPNESGIATAKVVSITAGVTIDGVNFSGYVPASQSPLGQRGAAPAPAISLQRSTADLSGVIRFSDGSPASGITVVAAPVSGQFPVRVVGNISTPVVTQAVTNLSGRYRLQGVSPDTYYIVAGYSDSPVFFPGVSDAKAARAVTTGSTTLLDNLDLKLPTVTGTSVHVRVSNTGGRYVGGAALDLSSLVPGAQSATYFLPPRVYKPVMTGGDGTTEISGVIPGKYSIDARLPGASTNSRTVDVGNQPLNLDFTFPVNVLTGRVLWEDGSPFSDTVLDSVAVSTTTAPNLIETTVFTLSSGGLFSGVLESGVYRFYVRNLPQKYQIRSITSGAADLTKEALRFGDDLSADLSKVVEVRVARRTDSTQRVFGKVVDAVSGRPPAAERIQLCCLMSGPFERMSTELDPSGAFEFSGVPAGRFSAELKGKTAVKIANSSIDAGAQRTSALTLVSAEQFATLKTTISFDGSVQHPGVEVSVKWTPASGEPFQITSTGPIDGELESFVPVGVEYNVTISNIPAGFKVKSLEGSDPQSFGYSAPPNSPSGYAGVYRVSGKSSITITLTRNE